jgi:hypothetical protein
MNEKTPVSPEGGQLRAEPRTQFAIREVILFKNCLRRCAMSIVDSGTWLMSLYPLLGNICRTSLGQQSSLREGEIPN